MKKGHEFEREQGRVWREGWERRRDILTTMTITTITTTVIIIMQWNFCAVAF